MRRMEYIVQFNIRIIRNYLFYRHVAMMFIVRLYSSNGDRPFARPPFLPASLAFALPLVKEPLEARPPLEAMAR